MVNSPSLKIEQAEPQLDHLESRPILAAVATAALSILIGIPILLHLTSGLHTLRYFFVAVPIGIALTLLVEKSGVKTVWAHISALLSGLPWRAIVFGPVCLIRDDGQLSLRVGRRWFSHSKVQLYCPANESDDDILVREQRQTRIQALLIGAGTLLMIALLLTLAATITQPILIAEVSGVLAGILIGDLAAVGANPKLRRAWTIDRNQPATQRHLAVYRLASHSISGVRPRDFDLRLLEAASYPKDQSSTAVAGLLFRYRHALDTASHAEAGRYLDEMIARCTLFHPELHWAVYGEAAFYFGYIRGDAEAARVWLNKKSSPPPEMHTEARIKSAVLFAAGETSKARALAQQGLGTLQPTLIPGLAEFDKLFLDAIVDATAGRAAGDDSETR